MTEVTAALAARLNGMCPSAKAASLGDLVTGLVPAEVAVLDGVTAGTVTASKAIVVDANKDISAFRNVGLTGVLQIGAQTTTAWGLGAGISATPLSTATTDSKFGAFFTKSTDATGADSRGLYWQHTLGGAGGAQSGEAGRFRTTVGASNANAARGIHSTLDFISGGGITGLGTALTGTVMVPNATLGGTVGALQAVLNAEGTSSNVSNTAFLRADIDGNATGADAIATNGLFMTAAGLDIGTTGSKMFSTITTGAASHGLKAVIDGTTYYFMLCTATS